MTDEISNLPVPIKPIPVKVRRVERPEPLLGNDVVVPCTIAWNASSVADGMAQLHAILSSDLLRGGK
jgi:hypothetical protein